MKDGIVILEWRPVERGTLIGFARVKVEPWHLVFDGCAVHKKSDRRWVALPARPQIDKDGQALRDESGKVKYAPALWFSDRTVSDRFSASVIAALDRFVAASERVEGGMF
jgi:hypothetical protein